MKHIKLFEENFEYRYWLLPTDDRFEKSLKQIGCRNEVIKSFLDLEDKENADFIYVAYGGVYGWECMFFSDENIKNYNDYFEKRGYIFMGAINLEDYELDAIKYNL